MSATHFDPNGENDHVFDHGNPVGERKTWWVVILTAVMMVVEIVGGWMLNSMALLADGWHMTSHLLAFGLALASYIAARRLRGSAHFTFGTWKIEVLGGYTSAILLVGIAVMMMVESLARLVHPATIAYNEAIVIAIFGLLVNVVSAWILSTSHGHDHSHGHAHADHEDDHHHHHDLNLRSAYIHVLTDAATSILAIFALTAGKLWGTHWLDPVMGIVGAVVVGSWAIGLIRESGRVLLDAETNPKLLEQVEEAVQKLPGAPKITDLHLWRVGRSHYACIISLDSREPLVASDVRRRLGRIKALAHVTVEIDRQDAPVETPYPAMP